MRAVKKIPVAVSLGLGSLGALLWCGAALAEVGRLAGRPPGPAPALLALASAAGLSAAATRPDLWAGPLAAWAGPRSRALLPLGLALLAVPLALTAAIAMSSLATGGISMAGLFVLLAAATWLLGRRSLAFTEGQPLRLAGPLACFLGLGSLALAGSSLRLHQGRLDTHAQATRAYLASLPGPERLIAQTAAGEALAKGAPPRDPAAPIRPEPLSNTNRFEIGTPQAPLRLELACLNDRCGLSLASSRRSPVTQGSPLTQGMPVRRGAAVDVYRDWPRGRTILSIENEVFEIDAASLSWRPLTLSSLAPFLAIPRLWLAAPLAALALALALLLHRRRAAAWHLAIASGSQARAEGGWLLFPDGRPESPAPPGLRDGPVVLLDGDAVVPSYRNSLQVEAGQLLLGRRAGLAARALANVQLIDAWALALAALAAAPLAAAAAVGLLWLPANRGNPLPEGAGPIRGGASLGAGAADVVGAVRRGVGVGLGRGVEGLLGGGSAEGPLLAEAEVYGARSGASRKKGFPWEAA